MNKRFLSVAVIAALALGGCLKSSDGGTSTPRSAVMVDLVSPNATATNIYLNGTTIGTNISYGSTPVYYNQVNSGTTTLLVENSAKTQLLSSNFATAEGRYYTVFAVDSANRMKAIAVMDSVTQPGTDTAKVRFFNFSPNSPALDIAIVDSSVVWSSHAFETQATANATNTFKGIKAGTHNFQIRLAGTSTVLKTVSATFESQRVYTLFTKGFYSDTAAATIFGLGMVKHG